MSVKSMGILMVPLLMAFAAGAVLPFQAASNSHAGRLLGHPLWGALVSLAVSSLVLLPALVVARAPAPNVVSASHGPWWLWIGGLLGAIYVGSAAAITPRLGAGGFLACVVAGQIIMAIVVDHFGWMGLAPKPVTMARFAGAVLILAGVALVQGLPISREAAHIAP